MAQKTRQRVRTAAVPKSRRRRRPPISDEEEELLRKATIHLVFKEGMFLVATGVRKLQIKGIPVWIFGVTLRYTTGHEGYYGDLLYDGEGFTFLTPAEVRKERAEEIANDPEGIRKWNEYRASTLCPEKE